MTVDYVYLLYLRLTTSLRETLARVTCGVAIPVVDPLHAHAFEILADDMHVQRLERGDAVVAAP